MYRNYAFISYSHRDMRVARWLQRELENFRLPSEVHSDIEAAGRYLRPVFRDQADLNSGVLGDELRLHLEQSKYLLIICSEYSARSAWVSDEARAFVEMGRLDRIIPVMLCDSDGGHEIGRQLFPEYLRDYFAEHPDRELLGVLYDRRHRRQALLRIVSRMIGVPFDSLWQRHRRLQRIRRLAVSGGVAALGALGYLFGTPVRCDLQLQPLRPDLPLPEHASVSIGDRTYPVPLTACGPSAQLSVTLPGYCRFRQCPILVQAPMFKPLDTMCRPGLGMSQHILMPLQRDDTFGRLGGWVYDSDMRPRAGVEVRVGDSYRTVTDARGRFDIHLRPADQRTVQTVQLNLGQQSRVIDDETPSTRLRYIL